MTDLLRECLGNRIYRAIAASAGSERFNVATMAAADAVLDELGWDKAPVFYVKGNADEDTEGYHYNCGAADLFFQDARPGVYRLIRVDENEHS